MISFFRRLRQRFLSENRFTRYAVYSIGEILLVVIGILIALQINNWNEQQKSLKKGDEYINNIINDLERDIENIDSLLVRGQQNIDNTEAYFKYFENQNDPIREIIKRSMEVRLGLFRYTPINFTFEDMQFSGNSGLLTEDQRAALADLDNSQQYFDIVFEKTIQAILEENKSVSEYIDVDFSDSDFFEKIGVKQPEGDLVKGLLHRHNALSGYHSLGVVSLRLREVIGHKSRIALKRLQKK